MHVFLLENLAWRLGRDGFSYSVRIANADAYELTVHETPVTESSCHSRVLIPGEAVIARSSEGEMSSLMQEYIDKAHTQLAEHLATFRRAI